MHEQLARSLADVEVVFEEVLGGDEHIFVLQQRARLALEQRRKVLGQAGGRDLFEHLYEHIRAVAVHAAVPAELLAQPQRHVRLAIREGGFFKAGGGAAHADVRAHAQLLAQRAHEKGGEVCRRGVLRLGLHEFEEGALFARERDGAVCPAFGILREQGDDVAEFAVCLDGEDDAGRKVYRDGFSRRADKRATLPNRLFFGDGTHLGLIPLLKRYDFTLDENHATDADIALDPELLGKVFENLLASYNPETGRAVRSASGSFYTPREIVDYMVDEALRATLVEDFPQKTVDALLEKDFSKREAALAALDAEREKAPLIARLRSLKILDPACGSGAFPMGLLNRLVELLGELGDDEDVYHRKLRILANGIYGVDIQPIAAQISKLRFFISLLCDQKVDLSTSNAGLDQLPNLETHLVIANSLIGFNEGEEYLIPKAIQEKREELKRIRATYVQVHTRAKKLALRAKDRAPRGTRERPAL